jgi:hypothetical protein
LLLRKYIYVAVFLPYVVLFSLFNSFSIDKLIKDFHLLGISFQYGENEVRLQALHRAPPSTADSVGCETGRGTCSERETGTEELCEIKWDYHIDGMRA